MKSIQSPPPHPKKLSASHCRPSNNSPFIHTLSDTKSSTQGGQLEKEFYLVNTNKRVFSSCLLNSFAKNSSSPLSRPTCQENVKSIKETVEQMHLIEPWVKFAKQTVPQQASCLPASSCESSCVLFSVAQNSLKSERLNLMVCSGISQPIAETFNHN